ncbi:MAG TPA: MarR family transcriptional regulator [Candidatus Blautia faecipullorum]|nr:MarR family transcriptional regulator [Candidatus Blautia faecipullorum]
MTAEKFRKDEMVFLMKKINIDLEIRLEKALRRKNLSGTQVYFLVYILRHHPLGTYITELCREVGISKATLSVLVKKLREKGYLCFRENPGDVRKKMILPTEKLNEEGAEFLRQAERLETEICGALEPGETQRLWELENKILTGLSETEKRQEDKK